MPRPGYWRERLEGGQKGYDIPVDLKCNAQMSNAGKYRMRIVLRDDEKDKFMANEDVGGGQQRRYSCRVKDSADPSANISWEIAFLNHAHQRDRALCPRRDRGGRWLTTSHPETKECKRLPVTGWHRG